MHPTLIRSMPSAVVALDPEGHIVAVNGAAERLFGTSAGEAVGRPYPSVFGPSLSDRMVGLFLRAARSANPDGGHLVEATLPDGLRATLRASVGPTYGTEQKLVGMLFVAEDCAEEDTAASVGVEQPAAEEAQRLREALKRYMGDAIAAMIDARPSFLAVRGVRQEVSVLHADVRGYTTVAEELPPDELLRLLSRYHGPATAALQTEGGTIDRFIGDAVLALWNAPAPQEQHARLAIRGAIAMRAATQAVGADLAYGIGVHTGEVVVGNLGSDRYMNFTAIGDTVNVAARLQSAASGGEVVCSAAALAAAGGGIDADPLGELSLKGRQAPVEAYRVKGIEG